MRTVLLRHARRGSLDRVTRGERDPSVATPPADARGVDDPSRLADEARAQREKLAAELRSTALPIETEPATTYRVFRPR